MMYGMSAMNYKKQAGLFRAALYCRLSKDDDLQGESASISNQRELLTSVCKANGWDIVEVYQDDGYTGLNMERPGLKKLLADVEQGLFNLVMTKDLSRLGRNYLQTGHLIEDFFPRHGVRYIALNDNIDTMMDSNEIAPFKNILNEMLSLRRAEQKQHRRTALGIKTGDSSSNVGDESSAFYAIVYFFHSGTSSVRVKLLFRLPRKLRDMPIKQKPCHTMMAGLYP